MQWVGIEYRVSGRKFAGLKLNSRTGSVSLRSAERLLIDDWLVHLYPPITRKRRCAMLWTNPHPLRSWPFSKLSCWRFDFFPRKFAACLKPPSRDNYRKAFYPRTQQRDQGAGWTHDPAIRVVVKTTLLPIQPRCRHFTHISIQFTRCGGSKRKTCKRNLKRCSELVRLNRRTNENERIKYNLRFKDRRI